MKIKLSELYNPILGGMPYSGFINVIREKYNLDSTYPFLKELCDTIDRFLLIKKGTKLIDEQISNMTVINPDYPYLYLLDIFNAYKNELNKTWEAMNMSYNPLENYSMTESGTDKNSGSDMLIMNRGTYNNTTRNYSHSRDNTDYKGTNSTSTTNNGGKDTTTSAKGTYTNRTLKNGGKDSEVAYKGTSQNTVNNNYKTSYDSNSPVLSEKNTSDISNHGKDKTDYYKNTSESENIHNHGQDKDTIFYNSKNKTTIKNGGRDRNVEKITDKETFSNHNHGQDKNEQKYGHNITHNLKRSGNIGVTTSQQMLQSEYEVLKFNFVNRIIEIIDNEFLSCMWGD